MVILVNTLQFATTNPDNLKKFVGFGIPNFLRILRRANRLCIAFILGLSLCVNSLGSADRFFPNTLPQTSDVNAGGNSLGKYPLEIIP